MPDTAEMRPARLRLRQRLAILCRAGRRILFVALLPACLLAGPAAAGDLQDSPANRHRAAEAYLEAYPLEALMRDTTGAMLQAVPPEYHEAFREAMKEAMDRVNIKELSINAIVKHFTVKEISAMAEFYASPEGQSITKKFPAYMEEMLPAIIGIVLEVAMSFERKPGG